MIPACGPPRSLSPLNITTETPASTLCFTVGSLTPYSESSTRLPDPRSSTTGRLLRSPRATSSSRAGLSVKPVTLKFEGCTRSSKRVFFVDGVLVVRKVCAIGRADFAKDRPALLHDLGDSKAIPDFDELPARDDHFASARQRRERHQHRRSAIVHHDRRFRSGQSR